MRITNYSEAQWAHSELLATLGASKHTIKPLPRHFGTELKAERHVWGRQLARSEMTGHLQNSVRHLKRGTSGAGEIIATLGDDITKIGDGAAPVIVGDVRAHAAHAAAELRAAMRAARPGPRAIIAAGVLSGIAALAWNALQQR